MDEGSSGDDITVLSHINHHVCTGVVKETLGMTSIGYIWKYSKVPKFLDTRKLCCNHPKIQTKKFFHRKICPKGADGVANSVDPDQTAPQGAV